MDYQSEKNLDKIIKDACSKCDSVEGRQIHEYIKAHPEEATTEKDMERFRRRANQVYGNLKTPLTRKRTIKRAALIAAIAVIIMAVIATVVIATRLASRPYIFKEITSDGATIWMTQDPTQEDFEHGSRLE